MVDIVRAVVPPAEGYGDEPKNERDVLLMAAARVQDALPESWAIQLSAQIGESNPSTTTSRPTGYGFSLARDGTTMLTFSVEVKRVLASGSTLSVVNRLLALRGDDPGSARPMLVARYLNPQQQRTLRQNGISYADATGNLRLATDDPLVILVAEGASADPWRGPGRPTTSLKGLPAAKLVRALADFVPPYSVADLAAAAGASLGAAYRLSDYLAGEGLLRRAERGPVTEVDWPELLRRWSREARYRDTSTVRGFLEPRGVDGLLEKLSQLPREPYAVSGSVAAQPYAPYAEARLALIYSDDPATLIADLRLRPVEAGANVILAVPRSPVVFERTTTWRGITLVAPSQAVADLLAGPGRNPAEGEYLLDWMKENPDAWRRQLDR